jgi:hypothetical protein
MSMPYSAKVHRFVKIGIREARHYVVIPYSRDNYRRIFAAMYLREAVHYMSMPYSADIYGGVK